MLRGRARELEIVGRLLRDVRGGPTRAIVVDGMAGIGKSSLVTAAAAEARRAGWRVLAGAAEPAEHCRPFAALVRMLEPGGSEDAAFDETVFDEALSVARRSDGGAAGTDLDAGALGFRVTDAIVAGLDRLASAGPVLLVLDDLHWADRSSTETLDAIQRRLLDRPIALMVTVRPGECPPHGDALLARLGGRTLSLGALADDAVAELVEELTGARAGGRLRRQLAKAEGNPFYVTELVRALDDEGALRVDAGVVESTAAAVPSGVVSTVVRRLRLLPEETLGLLRFAAILGQSFSVPELARVAGRGTVDLLAALAPALRTHTVRAAGDRLAFGHALIWEGIYHDLPVAVRRALHREAASVLTAGGVSALGVVRHVVLGAEVGDTEAVTWLRLAAREVAPSSPGTAAELLGTALGLAPEGRARDTVVAELAPLLVVVGEVAQAKELTEAALARGVDPAVEARLRAGLSHVLMRRGRVGDAKVQAIKLLELVPAEARESVRGIASFVVVTAGEAAAAEEMAERTLAASERAGHDLVSATALMTLTWTYGAHGRVEDAIAAGRRAVAASEGCRATMSGLLFPHCPLGAALVQADRFAEADAAFRDGLIRAERTEAPGTLVYHRVGLAASAFLRGDWETASAEAETALDVGIKTGTSWNLLPSAVLARIAVARDDLAAAQSFVDKATRAPEAGHTTMTLDWLYWADAVLQDARGATGRAVVAAERAWRVLPELRGIIGNRVAPVDCVRIALAAGNHPLAEDIAAGMAELAARSPITSLRAAALHCRGLVSADIDALRSALALLEGTSRRYQQAMLNEDTAALLGVTERSSARGLFRAALTAYRELGASRDVARVSSAMRAAGLRPGGVRSSGNVLTTMERAVAGLVAEGLSNPQIAQRLYISRHTAETHMKHIFAKLGLSSRAELAALVAKGLVTA